jgi:hypothetical protein
MSLTHRKQFFAFCLMLHFSIWPIWTFAPAVVVIGWSIMQSIFLDLTYYFSQKVYLGNAVA